MNIGLVLSGGGVRGVAHIGAIKALEEHGISPTHIAGTSSGAIVGALYANGLNHQEMLEFFNTLELFKMNKYARNKPGFIDSEKFYEGLKAYFPVDSFEALEKKLFVTTTEILEGKLKVFQEGELILSLLASASFPGVFSPVRIGDGYYADGGVLNNFPVEVLETHCERIIGVYVNPFEPTTMNQLRHSYNIVERAYHIKSANDSIPKFEKCDLVILPMELSNYGMFAFKKTNEIFELGYRIASELLDSISTTLFTDDTVEFTKNSEMI